MAVTPYFTRETFAFLEELADNNERAWFGANKGRYEDHVKVPALRFIQDFAPHLARISAHFTAGPRSLFRIHRDVRFSRDKSPYKTHLGIQFRHDAGRNVHAPGYYFHVEPGEVFVALGLWHPDGPATRKIREAMVEDPAG
ncbi:MAG: TIGR02453 family protein, partial [Gemmatimonadota bacterium]